MSFQRLTKQDARREMAALVLTYQRHAAELERPASRYTESETRGEFIDRFLMILGWDVHNQAGLPQIEREVVLERTRNDETGVTGRPDYRLRVKGRDRLPVEAKKPSIRLASTASAAVQARSYGWSMSLPASVLTNFAETIIFNSTITPNDHDSPDVAVIPSCRFSVNDYTSRFDELWERLSYNCVSSDEFYHIFEYDEPPRGTSPFDQTFLAVFRKWRHAIAQDIARQNSDLGAPEIGRRTQQLLNALLFLRVCEDRDIGQYENLLRTAEANQVITAFRAADRVFNAGLFSVMEGTSVSPDVLAVVIREMYWPRSKFAFGVLRPDILAALYEQYLAERVELNISRHVRLVEKPELTHAGGIVPTPQFVVEALLDEALNPVISSDKGVPADLSLLDPACGSGVFLVAGLVRLFSVSETAGNRMGLTERAELARRHVFGIDLDGAAVEVTKLSLLLAVLGDEVIDTDRARNLLPDLSSNIQVGNTLISTDFDQLVPAAAAVPERRAAVAPVNLTTVFSTVISRGGFTVIVGNPPYTRIQTLSRFLSDHLSYFQNPRSGLLSSQSHSFDTYLLFIERGLSLLANNGRLAFIIPNRFTSGLAGAHVRRILGPRLERLVHFGEEQVFENRTTYTALVVAGPATTTPAIFELVSNLASWRTGIPGDVGTIDRHVLTADPWPIATSAQTRVFTRMQEAAIAKLGDEDWLHVFVGVQTSRDNVFFIVPDQDPTTSRLVSFADHQGRRWRIESDILRPALRDRKIEPYDVEPYPDAWAIFPYVLTPPRSMNARVRAQILSPDQMTELYPNAFRYLSAHRTTLEGRDVTPDPGPNFWAYGRSQSLTQLDDPKIIVRVLSQVPRYAVDSGKLLVPGGGDGGPYYLLRPRAACPYSLEVVVALLSHPAVDAFVASRGKAYRGSYVVHRKRFLIEVPVPQLDDSDQRRIEQLVNEIQTIVVRLRTESDNAIRVTLLGRSQVLRQQVETIISTAYGLTDDDVQAVLG